MKFNVYKMYSDYTRASIGTYPDASAGRTAALENMEDSANDLHEAFGARILNMDKSNFTLCFVTVNGRYRTYWWGMQAID